MQTKLQLKFKYLFYFYIFFTGLRFPEHHRFRFHSIPHDFGRFQFQSHRKCLNIFGTRLLFELHILCIFRFAGKILFFN